MRLLSKQVSKSKLWCDTDAFSFEQHARILQFQDHAGFHRNMVGLWREELIALSPSDLARKL